MSKTCRNSKMTSSNPYKNRGHFASSSHFRHFRISTSPRLFEVTKNYLVTLWEFITLINHSNRFDRLVVWFGYGTARSGLHDDILFDHFTSWTELCSLCHTHSTAAQALKQSTTNTKQKRYDLISECFSSKKSILSIFSQFSLSVCRDEFHWQCSQLDLCG